MGENDDYKVGYGKPPAEHRFKKGQSGNPNGRKQHLKNASTILNEELNLVITVREGGKDRRLTKRAALIKALVNDAIGNRPNARKQLIDLLNISPPPEPWLPDEGDERAMQELVSRLKVTGETNEE